MINIELDEKPISVSIKYNGYYKLVLLLAIIKYCGYSKKATLELIHVVFWSLRNDQNYAVLFDLSKQTRRTLVPWSFEPGIDEVLSLGFINDFLERALVQEGLEIQISFKGEQIMSSINRLQLFQEEIEKIKNLGKIPKNRLTAANKNWTLV